MNQQIDISMKKLSGMLVPLNRLAALIVALSVSWIMLAVPAAYGAGGAILWQQGDGDTAMQTSTAAASDSSGNVFLTGFAQNATEDFYTIKMTADGGVTRCLTVS